MFAVLKTGGKQYKVQSGDVERVEKVVYLFKEKMEVFCDVSLLLLSFFQVTSLS